MLLPALTIFRMFGGVEHAPRSSRLVGSVSSSILVHNWAIIVLCVATLSSLDNRLVNLRTSGPHT